MSECKQNNLSRELSRLRALALAGAPVPSMLSGIETWRRTSEAGSKNQYKVKISNQAEMLEHTLKDAAHSGASVESLLKETLPRVRRLERFAVKMDGLERQFAFQAAIAIVLPWFVVFVQPGAIQFNFLYVIGGFFQCVGALLFYWLLVRSSRSPSIEKDYLFQFLSCVWMGVKCGSSLSAAVMHAFDRLGLKPHEKIYHRYWKLWFEREHNQQAVFEWPLWAAESRSVADILSSLSQSGAPAAEVLSNLLSEIEDDRQDTFEQRLQELPTRLALVFCLSFTPAVFCILRSRCSTPRLFRASIFR